MGIQRNGMIMPKRLAFLSKTAKLNPSPCSKKSAQTVKIKVILKECQKTPLLKIAKKLFMPTKLVVPEIKIHSQNDNRMKSMKGYIVIVTRITIAGPINKADTAFFDCTYISTSRVKALQKN